MTWSRLAHASAGGSSGGTTASIDTTGADILIAVVTGRGPPTISDSKSNTWTGLTSYTDGTQFLRIYYSKAPTVGTGHTFTVSGASTFSVVSVDAYSGSNTSAPFDVENGASNTGTPSTSGSITPTGDNELIVSGICLVGAVEEGDTPTISTFTRDDGIARTSGNNFGNFIASYAQTSATAINASWVNAGDTTLANIAAFKPAAAGGAANDDERHYPRGVHRGVHRGIAA